jgi:hypothetical protein
MPIDLSSPSGVLLQRLLSAGRYLDDVAANVRDQKTADVARAHANAVWDAATVLRTVADMLATRES